MLNTIPAVDSKDNIGFRIGLRIPTYVLLSEEICNLKINRNYKVNEGKYITELGLVPVYFASLNNICILKLYGERTSNFFSPINDPFHSGGKICWNMTNSSEPLEYSSINFILLNESEITLGDPFFKDACEKYFAYSYWASIREDFSPSLYFLNSRERIDYSINVFKSICIVERFEEKIQVVLNDKRINGINSVLKIFSFLDNNPSFKHKKVFIDDETAAKIMDQSKKDKVFLIALISEINNGREINSVLTVIEDIGRSYFDLLLYITGIVLSRIYYSTDSLSMLGRTDETVMLIKSIVNNMYRQLKIYNTLSEYIDNSFDMVLSKLFPLIIKDGEQIHFVHPLILGLIKEWRLFEDKMIKENITRLIRLINTVNSQSRWIVIYTDPDTQYFSDKVKLRKDAVIRRVKRVSLLVKAVKQITTILSEQL